MIAASSFGGFWEAHPVILSLGFAVVMILSDYQDSSSVRKNHPWWLRVGLLLLAAFTVSALVKGFWPSALIGLLALYVDVRLLMRRKEPSPAANPKP